MTNTWIKRAEELLDSLKRRGRAKLPDLKLAVFKGDLLEWPDWWERFLTTIDEREDIPDSDKLNYLKHYVAGPAAKTIEGFIGSGQYSVVKETLRKQYDRPKILLMTAMKKLQQRDKVSLTLASLKDFLDSTFATVQTLKKGGYDDASLGMMLTSNLADKLPDKLHREWAEEDSETDSSNIQDFIEFLRRKVHVEISMETGGKTKGGKEAARKPPQPSGTFLVAKGTTRGKERVKPQRFTRVEGSKIRPPKYSCPVCKDRLHRPSDCQVMLKANTDERRRLAAELRLCFKCLKPGHMAKVCNATERCKKCNRAHHTLLHIAPTKGKGQAGQK